MASSSVTLHPRIAAGRRDGGLRCLPETPAHYALSVRVPGHDVAGLGIVVQVCTDGAPVVDLLHAAAMQGHAAIPCRDWFSVSYLPLEDGRRGPPRHDVGTAPSRGQSG